jgi:putative hydrolase of the HAD superfamily
VILWDFDGTLAARRGMWRECLAETLDEHEPGHGVEPDDLVPYLRDAFPWHRPDVSHPELSRPGAWWAAVEGVLASAYSGVGYGSERATELARLAHARYVDTTLGWRLFEDTVPVLRRLSADGWRHVILSNHVPELPEMVDALGLGQFVDLALTSATTGFEKPHPDAFAIALKAVGSPARVWMVGDSLEADVEGAETVGIPAILVRASRPRGARYAADLWEVERLLGHDGGLT